MRFTRLLFTHLHLLCLAQANIIFNRIPQSPPAPTSPAILPPLEDSLACFLVGEALAICDSLTPNFKDLAPTLQAQCLCYSSTLWVPAIFDSAIKSCADYAPTSDTSAYPALANLEGFCNSIGNVVNPANNQATATASGSNSNSNSNNSNSNSNNSGACGAMNSFMSMCSQATPGFVTLDPTDQAKCLCYPNSGSWAPSSFDNVVNSCCQVAKTSVPALYSAVSTLEGFCASIGDVVSTSSGGSGNGGAGPYTTPAAQPSNTASRPTATSPDSGAKSNSPTSKEIGVTITASGAAGTAAQAGKNQVGIQRLRVEIIFVSFVCALVVLFLC